MFPGCSCFCARKRKCQSRSENLPGHQLQWAVALLQVWVIDRSPVEMFDLSVRYTQSKIIKRNFFFYIGLTRSRSCIVMRSFQRALSASCTLTWSFTSPQTKGLMAKRWWRLSSRLEIQKYKCMFHIRFVNCCLLLSN